MSLPAVDRSRRTRGRHATRGRILAAANDLFATRGLGATMEAIAAGADVAPATVFNDFPSKAAVLERLAADLFDAIASGIPGLRRPNPQE